MNLDDFAARLRGIVASLDGLLHREDSQLLMRLIDNNEGGEAILTLAWILVEQNLRVPYEVVDDIKEIAQGLIDPAELPPDLDSRITGVGSDS